MEGRAISDVISRDFCLKDSRFEVKTEPLTPNWKKIGNLKKIKMLFRDWLKIEEDFLEVLRSFDQLNIQMIQRRSVRRD